MHLDVFPTLEKFYTKLYDNIILKKKKVYNRSIILQFFNLKSNDRYRLLEESGIPIYKLDTQPEIIKYLEKKDYIRETASINNYVITVKGIWQIENNKLVINEKILLEFLDDKFFSFDKEIKKGLSDKEKIIIFSMIAIRSFSEDSAIELKRDETIKIELKNIVDDSYDILKSLKFISKLEKKDLYGKLGNELPVSNLFRHTDSLPRPTKGLFKALGDQKYYLDLYTDKEISKDNLKYLFKKIFDGQNPSIEKLNSIYDFCCKVAHNKVIYIFDINRHIFSKPKYDNVLHETLFYH